MSNKTAIRAVVFDLDGLLFNTEALYEDVMRELCRRRNLVFQDDLRLKMMGRPGEIAMQVMIEHHDLSRDDPAALLNESDTIFTALLAERLEPMPGMLALLNALESAGIPKAIGTSSRRKYVDYVLGRFELAERFDFILTAENVKHGKPHPEIYLSASAQHGVSPEAVMVFEDSENGCRAAVQAGTFAVAVPGDHSRNHDFQGAAMIANTLRDVRIYEALGILPSDSL